MQSVLHLSHVWMTAFGDTLGVRACKKMYITYSAWWVIPAVWFSLQELSLPLAKAGAILTAFAGLGDIRYIIRP